MTGYRISINPNEIAYCQKEDCGAPLFYLYSYEKRRYCHDCMLKAAVDNAREILKEGLRA